MKPFRLRWRFHDRPLACAFRRYGERFESLCGRYTVKLIGKPDERGAPPASLLRCPRCDSLNGG